MREDFPELIHAQPEINDALGQGKPVEGILNDLRARGVKTTSERLRRFCIGLRKCLVPASFDQSLTLSLRLDGFDYKEAYPDLEAVRKDIIHYIEQGMTPKEIYCALVLLQKIVKTESEVDEYVSCLFDEIFPAGPIQRWLFNVYDPEREWNDDDPILTIGDDPTDTWTVSDLCQGTLIMGAPGSGKTSGSGKTILGHMLKNGFGGLILTAKKEDAKNWKDFCVMAERGNDMMVVQCGGTSCLNILQYECERPGLGAHITSNIVSLFQNLFSVSGGHQQGSGTENGAFWQSTGQQLLTNLIDTFILAKEPLTLDGLCEFIATAPLSGEEAEEVQKAQEAQEANPNAESDTKADFFASCLFNAKNNIQKPDDQRLYKKLADYWLNIYPRLAPDTRSCITINFTSMADALRGKYIYDLISSRTSCTPEMILDGKIVIVDLSVAEFGEAGMLVQSAWKYLLQRALLRRPDEGTKRRPIFIWEDEGHNFLIKNDNEFQAVSREARAARILISQNLNNFYAKFGGGDYAKVKVDSLLANINTRVFHANGDMATNNWASEYIGTEEKIVVEETKNPVRYEGNSIVEGLLYALKGKYTVSKTNRVVREPTVLPQYFQDLQVGNAKNGWVTMAVMTQVGRTSNITNRNFSCALFRQIKNPDFQITDELAEEGRKRLKEANYGLGK